ncbi:hypothetical protein P6N53_01185 [Desulforamulus aquiferis]|uniref:Uncharacterized protein n=1 Tax=Desulforamulus aquiferis TaxID=1397668 RepID=A0AAW7Z7B0_9FIRM|nr:hypothetical protein [Desulforamulus aquiferis]MDO7785843.1 hypothetical protein [Desulforamulus aquiferis]RYD05045.1 hypothetical protein N752_11355 [Desulforamulus aquiferis]
MGKEKGILKEYNDSPGTYNRGEVMVVFVTTSDKWAIEQLVFSQDIGQVKSRNNPGLFI